MQAGKTQGHGAKLEMIDAQIDGGMIMKRVNLIEMEELALWGSRQISEKKKEKQNVREREREEELALWGSRKILEKMRVKENGVV